MAEKLERVKEKWNQAWLDRDSGTVEAITADDYVYIGPQGQVLDRAAILEIVRSPTYRLAEGKWTGVSVSHLSDDCALVLDRFQGEGEYRGQEFEEDHRHTTVWVRRKGRWQVRLEHCSTIEAG